MAGLTIKHGTHVRRAPGWKGAPVWHVAKFLSMTFSLRCRLIKFCVRLTKRKFTNGASNEVPDWLLLTITVTERLSRRQQTFIGRYGGRELCILYLSCLCSVATSNVLYKGHQSWGHRPHYYANEAQRWSTVAIVLLNFCYNCYELMTFWSNKIANLPNQKPSSYADNGNMSLFSCQSVMVGQYCTDTVNEKT